MIYEIRGKQVILESDVAKLYNSETKIINQVVKRNINRFPKHFCFQLTTEEYNHVTRGGNRYLPYAFTEHGIMMLSSLLKNDIAVEINVKIINAFVTMRRYIGNNEYRISNVETKIIEHDKSIKLLQESFDKLEEQKEVNEIYFNEKIYDAYSKVVDIFKEANN